MKKQYELSEILPNVGEFGAVFVDSSFKKGGTSGNTSITATLLNKEGENTDEQVVFFRQHAVRRIFGVGQKPGRYYPKIQPGTIGVKEREFQYSQDALATIFSINRTRRTRTIDELEEDIDITSITAAIGAERGRDRLPKVEALIKVSRGLTLDIAEQKQNNLCKICGRAFGISIAKGSNLPQTLNAWFEHWIPDSFFRTVSEKNKNTADIRNCVTCSVCNKAKADWLKDKDLGIPLSLEEVKKISAAIWTRWTVLSNEEAYQRELAHINLKYGK